MKLFKILLFFILLISFDIYPVFGSSENVEINTQIIYNMNMDDTANVTVFISFYPNIDGVLLNGTSTCIIINEYENFSIYSFDNKSNLIKQNSTGIHNNNQYEHKFIFNFSKTILESHSTKIMKYEFITDTQNSSIILNNPYLYKQASIPQIRNSFNFKSGNNTTTKCIQVILPHDGYNYPKLQYSTIPYQHMYDQNKAITIIWQNVSEKHRTLGVYYTMHEATAEKLLDESTKKSEHLGQISVGLGIIASIISIISIGLVVIGLIFRIIVFRNSKLTQKTKHKINIKIKKM